MKTSEITGLVKAAFVLSDKEEGLLQDLVQPEMNLERCFYILQDLIAVKLDKGSVFAFLAYQLFKVLPEKADTLAEGFSKDEKSLYENFKVIKDIQNLTISEKSDDIKMMFLALSKDARTVIIKLAGISYDIKQLKLPLTKKDRTFVKLVKEIHIPLAERLGLDGLKLAMDDNVVRLEHPEEYQKIKSDLDALQEGNNKQIMLTLSKVKGILEDLNIKGEIKYRQKHISSIYKKLSKHTMDQIYDLLAMRLIVNTVEECYTILGRIHSLYKPMPGRVKDYIANPKPNGYQSLHTTVIVENDHPLEIQIRTFEMHRYGEFGNAAHWLYKENKSKKDGLDLRVTSLRETIENAKNLTPDEFVETLKADLYEGVIFCQTPKGRVIEFPSDVTVIDFAYAIHSDIGNSCVGARVNSKMVPISTKLKNGDIVEIITNPHSKGPSRDWLNIAKTSSAKSKIRAFFKNELKDQNIKLGKTMLEEKIRDSGYSPSELFADKYLEKVLTRLNMTKIEELYASVGSGSLTTSQVVNRFLSLFVKDNPLPQAKKLKIRKNKNGVVIDGDSGMLVRYANCCKPIQGDEIIGYISRGRGVTIHRRNCIHVKYLEPERLIDATWDNDEGSFVASICAYCDKNSAPIAKITSLLTNMKIDIVGLNAEQGDDKYVCTIIVGVKDKEELDRVISNLLAQKYVIKVFRSGR